MDYLIYIREGFIKKKPVNLGLWPKLGGGVRTGSDGPIELFGDHKCQNNESFFKSYPPILGH